MSDIQNLRVFFLTVGEPGAINTLDDFIKRTKQPYKLTVWYDACGRGVDLHFWGEMLARTKDVIVSAENRGTVGAVAYAMLYTDFDYLMLLLADTVVEEGYLDRMKTALARFGKVACAGSTRNQFNVKVDYDFVLNARELEPDGIMLFSKEAINEIGGIATAFKGMGQEQREWNERAMEKGWNIVSCNNIMTEKGTMHDGRIHNPRLAEEIAESEKTYLKIYDRRWKDLNWWDNKIEKEEQKQCQPIASIF